MSFFTGLLIVAVSFTITGVFIYFKEDFTFVPNLFYKNLKDEDKKEFITNYGKGVFLTGLCLIFALIDFSNIPAIRWTLFGFTLAYSDLYLKKARKLNVFKKLTSPILNSNKKVTVKAKTYRTIVGITVMSCLFLGGFLINSLYTLANNRPFQNYINKDDVELASVYLNDKYDTIVLNQTQLDEFIAIFENIVVYEEISTDTINADIITYSVTKNDGSIIELKAMGSLLFINLDGQTYKYTINEKVSEEFIFLAFSVI